MSDSGATRTWNNRLTVARAAIGLIAAKFLVHHIRFSRWRDSLGDVLDSEREMPARALAVPGSHSDAALIGRCVERAANRLPFATRCLPRAMAAQWLLRRHKIPSDLVFAVHLSDRQSEDAYHAWVEHDGQMIVGHCDRDLYRPVMVLSQRPARLSTPVVETKSGP